MSELSMVGSASIYPNYDSSYYVLPQVLLEESRLGSNQKRMTRPGVVTQDGICPRRIRDGLETDPSTNHYSCKQGVAATNDFRSDGPVICGQVVVTIAKKRRGSFHFIKNRNLTCWAVLIAIAQMMILLSLVLIRREIVDTSHSNKRFSIRMLHTRTVHSLVLSHLEAACSNMFFT